MLRYIKLSESAKPEELTALAYQLRSATPAAALTAASEALFLANPGLRDMKRVVKGTVLLVPDMGGRLPPAKEAGPVAVPLGGAGLLTDRQIEALAAEASVASDAAKERASQTAQLLKTAAGRKAAAEQAPEVEKLFADIVEAAKRAAESAQARERALKKVYGRMSADMKRLRANAR